jgi:hypothetical protein
MYMHYDMHKAMGKQWNLMASIEIVATAANAKSMAHQLLRSRACSTDHLWSDQIFDIPAKNSGSVQSVLPQNGEICLLFSPYEKRAGAF